MVMFGMGASFMALFARVGGGIFTKAADVGADLVGKVEAGIPEDDPRNPATIADNVGDNVGDVAGMGADLYESYVGSILATFALGVAAYPDDSWSAMLLPISLAVVGILCSIAGSFLIRTKEGASQRELLGTLRKGTYSAAILAAILAAPLTYFIVGNWGVYVAILCGLVGGCAIGYFTEYYTSDTYKPTQVLADSTETGAATTIIGGLSLGMMSTIAPILIVGAGRYHLLPGCRRLSGHRFRRIMLTCSPRACTASASPPWACCPPWASPWPPTPTAPWPTTPAASPRCPAWARRSVSAPTPWTPWATPPLPPARASPSAPPP